jgi:hypothetical protein
MQNSTLLTIPLSAALLLCVPSGARSTPAPGAPAMTHDACQRTAYRALSAARFGHREALNLALGNCLNITDDVERAECVLEAFFECFEGIEESEDQFDARLDLCDLIGGEAYDPDIDPGDFSSVIDNPDYPIVPGTTLTSEKATGDGTETVVLEHLFETRVIMDVECAAVRDTASCDGVVIEETIDYYAQDGDGNVWYFGEISKNFEDGQLTDLDGSWFAGAGGAKPGIIMHASPVVGTTYRQEWFLGEAEDVATTLALDAAADVPFGSFVNCVQTLDFTPIEPDAQEHKFYAAGIGVVLEIDIVEDERLELISIN